MKPGRASNTYFSFSNDVGLLPEEIDLDTGETLGITANGIRAWENAGALQARIGRRMLASTIDVR